MKKTKQQQCHEGHASESKGDLLHKIYTCSMSIPLWSHKEQTNKNKKCKRMVVVAAVRVLPATEGGSISAPLR